MVVVGLNFWDPHSSQYFVDLSEVLKVHLAAETHPVKIAQWEKLVELVECLKRETHPAKLIGHYLADSLRLCRDGADRINIEAEVTWLQYGPVENDLPIFHYRLRVMENDPKGYLTKREPRRSTAAEAARVIMTEFGLF